MRSHATECEHLVPDTIMRLHERGVTKWSPIIKWLTTISLMIISDRIDFLQTCFLVISSVTLTMSYCWFSDQLTRYANDNHQAWNRVISMCMFIVDMVIGCGSFREPRISDDRCWVCSLPPWSSCQARLPGMGTLTRHVIRVYFLMVSGRFSNTKNQSPPVVRWVYECRYPWAGLFLWIWDIVSRIPVIRKC